MLPRLLGLVAACLAVLSPLYAAAEPALVLRIAGTSVRFDSKALLARADARTIAVPSDVAYEGAATTYRAIPVADLLADATFSADGTIQVTALDGFVAQLPAKLLTATDENAARAYLAIEPTDAPWPKLKGKTMSAGPFYIVWTKPDASKISPEQWPYQIAGLESTLDPVLRWPSIDVAADLPPDAPARAGLAVFLKHCFACHAINGGGEAAIGPDLNRPMNPTEYFQGPALRRYIRDPARVRTWPAHKMAGFPASVLPEQDLDTLIAYLAAMPARRKD